MLDEDEEDGEEDDVLVWVTEQVLVIFGGIKGGDNEEDRVVVRSSGTLPVPVDDFPTVAVVVDEPLAGVTSAVTFTSSGLLGEWRKISSGSERGLGVGGGE